MEARLDHKNYKIRDLISDYRQGRLVIPEFQRAQTSATPRGTRGAPTAARRSGLR